MRVFGTLTKMHKTGEMSNLKIRNWATKANSNSRAAELIFGLLIFALGIAVRVNFVSGSDFPLNDGGFFYSMTEDLIDNNFSLLEYSSYNHADIPYAYPPLAFYLIGAISKLSRVSLFSLFMYFPLIVSCISIPVFFLLTKKFFRQTIYRLLAAYLFATLPRSFEWFVMGGGATRSLGFLFAMLSIYFTWSAFEDDSFTSNWIIGAILSSLTILSHPLSALFLAFSIFVIYLYHYPVKIQLLLMYSGIVLIASSPWWWTTVSRHGLSPFIGASGTGHFDWFEIKNLFTLNFGFESPYFLQIVSVLAVLGLFSREKKKSYFLGILCIVGYLVIPRGGADYLTAYLPLLATFGFSLITEPWNSKALISNKSNQFPPELKSARTRAFLIFIFIYVFLGAYTYKYVYNKGNLRLNDGNVRAMNWLRENSDETVTVLSIPVNDENRYWWNDYISEWLPAISGRKSVITVQGYEWKPDNFEERISRYWSLRNCSLEYACIDNWQTAYNLDPDYIFLDDLTEQYFLAVDLQKSEEYFIVFEGENVMILEKMVR